MRLAKEIVIKRENFATQQFMAGKDIDAVNSALVDLDGMKMAYPRLKELFDAAQKGNPVLAVEPSEEKICALPDAPKFVTPNVIISDGPFFPIHELVRRIENGLF